MKHHQINEQYTKILSQQVHTNLPTELEGRTRPPRVLPTMLEGRKFFLDCLGSCTRDNDTTTIYSSSSCNLYCCTSLPMFSIVTDIDTTATTTSYHWPLLPLFSVLSILSLLYYYPQTFTTYYSFYCTTTHWC